jgi:hypothetical protein
VESNEDHMVAIAAELEADFSLDVHPVLVSPSAAPDSIAPREVAAVDLVVTTVFHEEAARAAAAGAGKPCVVVSLNPQFAAEINKALSGREVTAVIADPAFGDRARAYLDVTPHRGRVRLVLVDQLGGPGDPVDLESDSVLVTRAARRRLGLPDHHLVEAPPTYISPASARELCEVIVALTLAESG